MKFPSIGVPAFQPGDRLSERPLKMVVSLAQSPVKGVHPSIPL